MEAAKRFLKEFREALMETGTRVWQEKEDQGTGSQCQIKVVRADVALG